MKIINEIITFYRIRILGMARKVSCLTRFLWLKIQLVMSLCLIARIIYVSNSLLVVLLRKIFSFAFCLNYKYALLP